MPNSFNSITKFISIFLLIFLSSCSSISHTIFPEKLFVGKISVANAQSRSNYSIRVSVLPENVIIQIGKPLFGNLLKIEFDYSRGLSFDPEVNSEYLSLLGSLNKKDYMNFFDFCFDDLKSDDNIFLIKKHDFELKCNYQNIDTFSFDLAYKTKLKIFGVLKRE